MHAKSASENEMFAIHSHINSTIDSNNNNDKKRNLLVFECTCAPYISVYRLLIGSSGVLKPGIFNSSSEKTSLSIEFKNQTKNQTKSNEAKKR